MPVTRRQIIARGLANRCPNCGGRTLFKADTLFELDRACRQCGLKLEKDEGFFLGAMAINYGVTCVGLLTPVAALWYFGVLPGRVAIGLAARPGPARAAGTVSLLPQLAVDALLFLPAAAPARQPPGIGRVGGRKRLILRRETIRSAR
jgi:hypothetical protein